MFRSSKNVDTIRRSSQRRNYRRLARIQRQITLETVLSNISSSVVDQPPTKISTITSFESVQVQEVQQSINISNIKIDLTESKSTTRTNDDNELETEGNRPLSPSSNPKDNNDDYQFVDDFNSGDNVDEERDAENLLIDSDNEESLDINQDDDDAELFNDFKDHTDHQFTSKEIAIVLSLLKSRHSLTNTCITNICKLLKLLHVPNAPSNFRHIRCLICSPYQTTIFGKTAISCPSCYRISSSSTGWTSSSTCISKDKFIKTPTANHNLSLAPQIRSIIERNHLINPDKNENIIIDIVDSLYYGKLLLVESNPLISLLMNSDGAVVKSISRSIWITSFVINELSPSVRFNRENLIIGMVCIGSSKHHKDEMQMFLNDLVKELIYLEREGLRYNPIDLSLNDEKTMRGCENVKVGDGNARAFVSDTSNDVELRSNQPYDEAIRLFEQPLGKQRRVSITSLNSGTYSLRGPCALRKLKNEYKKELDKIASTFKETFFLSSTFRIPRDLKLYSVYKANELKIFLLFGFLIFNEILIPERYDHFRCLAFAAHLIEASTHDQSTHHDIHDLLHEFYTRFELLYTKKQAKPVIHALSHFADTVKIYGPGHNYSTFDFESTIATLTRTIHNGPKLTVEMLNNVDLLQQTWLATNDPSFPYEMQLFDLQIHGNIRYPAPTCLSDLYNQQKARLYKKNVYRFAYNECDLLPLPKCYEFMAVIQQKLTDDCGVIKPTVRYSVSANQYLIQHHTAYMNEQLLPLEKIEEMFQCRKVNVVPIRIIDSHAYNNCKTSAPIILDSNEDFFGPNRTHKPGDDSIWKIESVMEKSTFPWIYPTGEGGELDMKRPISLKLRLMSANKTWQGYSILTFRAMNLIQKDDFCTAVNYHTIKKFN
ncbi:unnamed protein product [Rotaria magnacalcarata]